MATIDVDNELAALATMTAAQLRAKYLAVFGEPSRSGNRDYLHKRLAWRIQSLAEGTLSERARRRAAELARDADLRVTMPRTPAVTPQATTRVLSAPVLPDKRVPLPGTVLTRTYKGREVRVTVLTDGFDHDGTVYRSLSAVARAVTGTQWNGYLFFNLTDGDKQ